MKKRPIYKFTLLVFLLILLFSYAMFQGGFVSWFLLYSFLPFFLYNISLYFYSLKDLEITRTLPKWDFNAGESLKVKVIVKRRTRFPLFFVVMTDEITNPGRSFQQRKTKVLLLPGFKKEFFYEYTIERLPRGEHSFRSFTVEVGDMLGLMEKRTSFNDEAKIIVYPSYTEFLYRPIENYYEQGHTFSSERIQRDTSMAIGVRDYQPGDRFSLINWKATAKRNDLMTKEFEQQQSHDVLVVMDCAPDQRFEAVVSFTASLARSILKKGAQTGLQTFSREKAFLPIGGGDAQLQQFFYQLAKVEAGAVTSFDRVLDVDRSLVQQMVSLLLVTARLTKPLIEKASFLSRGKVIIFLVKAAKEAPSEGERSLAAMSNARGVHVVFVHHGQFTYGFSEVNAG